jgi:hypothetical protein
MREELIGESRAAKTEEAARNNSKALFFVNPSVSATDAFGLDHFLGRDSIYRHVAQEWFQLLESLSTYGKECS